MGTPTSQYHLPFVKYSLSIYLILWVLVGQPSGINRHGVGIKERISGVDTEYDSCGFSLTKSQGEMISYRFGAAQAKFTASFMSPSKRGDSPRISGFSEDNGSREKQETGDSIFKTLFFRIDFVAVHSVLLSFAPAETKNTGFHPIQVAVPSRPDSVIRVRPGYWAGK